MYFDYLNVLIFASVGILFVFVNMIVGSIIRPKRKDERGLEVYECGEETIGDTWIQFDIRYYTVALVYLIFAVEIAFLFPWALVLGEALHGEGAAAGAGIGVFALVEGVIFIAILFLGLAYVWLTRGVRYVPALETSLLILLEPVLSAIWAWWIHGEQPGTWALVGCTIILVSTAGYTFLRR